MNKKYFVFIIFLFFVLSPTIVSALPKGVITGTGVSLRTGPGTNYGKISFTLKNGNAYDMVDTNIVKDEGGCSTGWYRIYYKNTSVGYVCGKYLTVDATGSLGDIYGRPWTSPKKSINGGAKVIAEGYIQAGQYTAYLKKFNVNPATGKVYWHQYMANLQAPSSEARSTYKSYVNGGLINLQREFTIPIFTGMPANTTLPGKNAELCYQGVIDQAFENSLNEQGFDETYKCKLRKLHIIHPNWIFKSLKTNLDFNRSVIAEKGVSSIQGSTSLFEPMDSNTCKSYNQNYNLKNGYCNTEGTWYIANNQTVGYYLDPRNFLDEVNIMMFENLGYSANFTTGVVQTILNGTFMSGASILDNQTYAEIFVEAGKNNSVSAVYLASLARQESGVNGSIATTGAEFNYEGITYKGLYNFFNIGAYSTASSPIKAGLVYASGGYDSVKVNPTTPSDSNETTIINKIGGSKFNNIITNISVGTTQDTIRNRLSGHTVSFSGSGVLKTGMTITVDNKYTYTFAIKGDVDGDGNIMATDYVKIKNYIMERSGSELNEAQRVAADMDGNGYIVATDYVRVKNIIMGR